MLCCTTYSFANCFFGLREYLIFNGVCRNNGTRRLISLVDIGTWDVTHSLTHTHKDTILGRQTETGTEYNSIYMTISMCPACLNKYVNIHDLDFVKM